MRKRSAAGPNYPARTRRKRSLSREPFEGEIVDRNPGISLQHLWGAVDGYLRILYERYVREPSLPEMPMLQRLLRL